MLVYVILFIAFFCRWLKSIWQIIILSSAVKHCCAAAAGQNVAAAARQLSEFLSDVWPAN